MLSQDPSCNRHLGSTLPFLFTCQKLNFIKKAVQNLKTAIFKTNRNNKAFFLSSTWLYYEDKLNIIKSTKINDCISTQFHQIVAACQEKHSNKSQSGKYFLRVVFILTACQQLLSHTCDWLGLQGLRINTPGVPHSDVPLLYPAVHPQYVTITQKILSLKLSVNKHTHVRD